MTDERIRSIDEQISAFRWLYNSQSERFETRDGVPIEWEDIIVAVPELSLNELMAYEERKQREWGGSRRKAFAA